MSTKNTGKKCSAVSAVVCTIVLWPLLSGCVQNTTAGDSETGTAAWNYDGTVPVYTLASDVNQLIIKNISGMTVYMTVSDPADTSIAAGYIRYISGGTWRAADGTGRALSAGGLPDIQSVSGSAELPVDGRMYPVCPGIVEPEPCQRNAARTVSTETAAVTPIAADAAADGTTTKKMYLDSTTALTAVLRANGTYCHVWVVEDTTADASGNTHNYWTTEESVEGTKTINQKLADTIAAKFDVMYLMVRNVFGEESEVLWDTGNPLSTESATGSMVNIVVYDIYDDYVSKDKLSSSSAPVVGYFASKDYHSTSYYSSSNVGKYYYIDSAYAAKYPEMVYSTLAHEFQHMIAYSTKCMTKHLSIGSWYGEMMSMLCEDMMQEKLSISDDDSPKGRLKGFNISYYSNGVTCYQATSAFYAEEYAFGAWLARTYGGAALVHEMAANDSVDTACIVNAVNTVNGTSYSFADLFEQFTQACVFSNKTFVKSLSLPTFNRDASQTFLYTAGTDAAAAEYQYPMSAIDLWDGAYKNSIGGSAYYGPVVFNTSALYGLSPYGFIIYGVIDMPQGASELTVTVPVKNSSSKQLQQKVQFLVQPQS